MDRLGKYTISLIIFAVLVFVMHYLFVKPYIEDTALKAWYARQNVQWILPNDTIDLSSTDGSKDILRLYNQPLNDTLKAFIISRYVQLDGNKVLSSRKCDQYLHFFPFTDHGCGLSVLFDAQDWRVTSVESIPYKRFETLIAKEYVQECIDRTSDWRKLYRDDDLVNRRQHANSSVVLSALRRYTYTVDFQPMQRNVSDSLYYRIVESSDNDGGGGGGSGSAIDTGNKDSSSTSIDNTVFRAEDVPRSTYQSLLLREFNDDANNLSSNRSYEANSSSPLRVLTFTFVDRLTGRSWFIQLSDYKPSVYQAIVSPDNTVNPTGKIWERLPPLHLDRSENSTTTVQAENAVLFNLSTQLADDGSLKDNRALHPCWNEKINRFRLGNYAVDADSFSVIYLRGLQVLTQDNVNNDPTKRAILSRLFWNCAANREDAETRRANILSVIGGTSTRTSREENESDDLTDNTDHTDHNAYIAQTAHSDDGDTGRNDFGKHCNNIGGGGSGSDSGGGGGGDGGCGSGDGGSSGGNDRHCEVLRNSNVNGDKLLTVDHAKESCDSSPTESNNELILKTYNLNTINLDKNKKTNSNNNNNNNNNDKSFQNHVTESEGNDDESSNTTNTNTPELNNKSSSSSSSVDIAQFSIVDDPVLSLNLCPENTIFSELKQKCVTPSRRRT